MLPADYVFGFAVALVLAFNLYFGPRIERDRVAMQWGPNGEPTWYAPKWLAMWGIIIFMAAVRLFVDRRESAVNEAGDILIPMREGAFTADHIQAELGDVIIGKDPGRRTDTELTLFKSLGLAVEDVASAAFILKQARQTGVGQMVTM